MFLIDRKDPALWQTGGSQDHWYRARAKVGDLLKHRPRYLDKSTDITIRDEYPIMPTIPHTGLRGLNIRINTSSPT